VAERLREVAEQLAVLGVDLLGEEPEVVGVARQPAEELLGPLELAGRSSVRAATS
jgi:hypothetical protein